MQVFWPLEARVSDFRPFPSVAGGGVILYAGSSGSSSPSPGSPSSGYQTQSPSSHSQPSSPEEVTFTEIGVLKQRAGGSSTPSSKLVFQFPEVCSGPPAATAASQQHTFGHPIAGKRPCGFAGTFTSKWLSLYKHRSTLLFFFIMLFIIKLLLLSVNSRVRWDGPALQSLRRHCVWFPLWSACMRGLQGRRLHLKTNDGHNDPHAACTQFQYDLFFFFFTGFFSPQHSAEH